MPSSLSALEIRFNLEKIQLIHNFWECSAGEKKAQQELDTDDD